jgi:uncharacterized protein YdhG (YjbR/CyaY superfamily)
MPATNFQSIDEYIATFPKEIQDVLQSLRQTVKDAAPEAQEKISYQIPTFTLNGTLVHFAAYKNHIGFYGASGAMDALGEEVSPYVAGKGTLQFPLSKPLPLSLISDIVKLRAKENLEKAKARKSEKRSKAARN